MKLNQINPELAKLDVDVFHHFGFSSKSNLKEMFGNVRFVCMNGSPKRAFAFAKKVEKELGIKSEQDEIRAIGETERYSLYKVGPVISVSHGIGMPSLANLLNELVKMLYYAEVEDPIFIRMGTSGGIGVEPGTIVISSECINSKLEPFFEQTVMGTTRKYSTLMDHSISQDILNVKQTLPVILGKTLGTDSFFEEQCRSDSALDPGYSTAEKNVFLNRLYGMGVRNIEMESPCLAAFSLRSGLKAAIACVTLVDRLKGDQVTSRPDELLEYSERLYTLILNFIKSKMFFAKNMDISSTILPK